MRKIHSIQADFTQEKDLKILKTPLISKGIFLFQAPDMVRWEYKSPLRVVSLVHEGTVKRYVFTDSKKWVADSSGSVQAIRMVMQRIIGWLTGRFGQDDVFMARLIDGPPVTVILTPKNKGMAKVISKVEMIFSATPGVLNELDIHEGPNTLTRIRFEDVKLNKPIPAAKFEKIK